MHNSLQLLRLESRRVPEKLGRLCYDVRAYPGLRIRQGRCSIPKILPPLYIRPMKWITRERPKIDRIACPWLIKRFVDSDAQFIYVPFDEVIPKAKELNAIPFDLPDVEYTHYGDQCTFDYILKKHNLKDDALNVMAVIVRGADTDRHDIASQSSGLWAISAGLSYNLKDDQMLLEKGMM